jgi:ElaB/YqjD/DUF883 family membrane-anchored ribosome-binding protein
MPDQDLNALERDVEEARRRLALDLAQLRHPETMSTAKEEFASYRDDAIQQARDRATGAAQTWLEEARARVENNPVAALLVGAGVGWKLLRDPPIASLLFVAGVASLVRTHPAPGSRTPTTDRMRAARETALEQARAASLAAQEGARQASTQLRTVTEQARATGERFGAQATVLLEETRVQVAGLTDQAALVAARAAEYADDHAPWASDLAERARAQTKANPLLMGGGALALGAVVGYLTRTRRS